MSSKINLQTCEYACKSSIFQDNQLIFTEMFDILNSEGVTFLEHTRIVYTEAVAPACENAVRIPYCIR